MRAAALTTAGNLRVMGAFGRQTGGHWVGMNAHRRPRSGLDGLALLAEIPTSEVGPLRLRAAPVSVCGRCRPHGSPRLFDPAATGCPARRSYIRSIMALPKPEHDTCVDPGRSRAKS